MAAMTAAPVHAADPATGWELMSGNAQLAQPLQSNANGEIGAGNGVYTKAYIGRYATGDAKGGAVTVLGGEFQRDAGMPYGSIIGAYSENGQAQGEVLIQDGAFWSVAPAGDVSTSDMKVYGITGAFAQKGNATGALTIRGGDFSGQRQLATGQASGAMLFGAHSENGSANGTIEIFDGNVDNGSVIGGYSVKGEAKGSVTIHGGSFTNTPIRGASGDITPTGTSNAGSADGTVLIHGGTFLDITGATQTLGDAKGKVTFLNGSTMSIMGMGSSGVGEGTVNIAGGSVMSVMGTNLRAGADDVPRAQATVNLLSGDIVNSVVGVHLISEEVKGQLRADVTIGGDVNLDRVNLVGIQSMVPVVAKPGQPVTVKPASVYYGADQNAWAVLNIGLDQAVTLDGNHTVAAGSWSGQAASVKGFNVINFKRIDWMPRQAVLTLSDTLELSPQANNPTMIGEVYAHAAGNDDTVQVGAEMTLIDAGQIVGTIGNDPASTDYARVFKGVSTIYEGYVIQDGNTIKLKVGGETQDGTLAGIAAPGAGGSVVMNEQILVLGESRAAAVAYTNQGADLVNDTLDDIALNGLTGTHAFASAYGNASEYETGSHVDVNGWSLIAGAYHTTEGGLTLGGFFESGTGNYSTFNDIDGQRMRGDGEATYYGVGLLARQSYGNFYTEASVRLGRLENTLGGAVKGSQGLTGYDVTTFYAGGHLGVGHRWSFNADRDLLDVYGKVLVGYNESERFELDGDAVKFDAMYSERVQLGTRYVKSLCDNWTVRVGAAWEYEFDGGSDNSVAGYDLGTPDLDGSTVIGEVGVGYVNKQWRVDLEAKGFAGIRDGVIGKLTVDYRF